MNDRGVVYDDPGSPCSQRRRFVLNAKASPSNRSGWNGSLALPLRPEHLALKPNGVAPTLVHESVMITDSAVILEQLDGWRPEVAPLRPERRSAAALRP